MEKFKQKIKFKINGFSIFVIILLYFLAFSECQQLSRRRTFYPQQRLVSRRSRIQGRPELSGTRGTLHGNRRFTSQRRQNTNDVSRLSRQRERLDYLRQQRERLDQKIELQNAVLNSERTSRINSVHENGRQTGNNQFVRSGGETTHASINSVRRHNANVPAFRNRHLNDRSDLNSQHTQAVRRNNNGQSVRTYVGSDIQNSNRAPHTFIRPRLRALNRQQNQIASAVRNRNNNQNIFNNYSPALAGQNIVGRALPRVQTTTQRLTLPHFKPLAPMLLRQFHLHNRAPSTSVVHIIPPAVRSTSSGLIPSVHIRPTSQSFAHQPNGVKNTKLLTSKENQQGINANGLASPVQTARVNLTGSAIINLQASMPARRNIHVLMPFPSVVPKYETSSGPARVLNRKNVPKRNTVLRVNSAALLSKISSSPKGGTVIHAVSGQNPAQVVSQNNIPKVNTVLHALSGQNPAQVTSQHDIPKVNTVLHAVSGQIPAQVVSQNNIPKVNTVLHAVSGQIPAQVVSQNNIPKVNTVLHAVSGQTPAQVVSQNDIPKANTVLNAVSGQNPAQVVSQHDIPKVNTVLHAVSGQIPAQVVSQNNIPKVNTVLHAVSGQTPTQSQNNLPKGNTVLQVVPASPPVAPTVANIVPVVAYPSHNTQNLGLSLGTGLHGGLVSRNVAPILAATSNIAPNTYPVHSWFSHFLLGGEQPDSPDPTDAAKTVTEVVSLLSSTTQGGSPTTQGGSSAGEEEEIEWEDMPTTTTTAATTTTTTTLPAPTTQLLTTPSNSVIKSIAQRIVALLVQKSLANTSHDRKIPKNQANTKHTSVFVQPTSPDNAVPVVPIEVNEGSVIAVNKDIGAKSGEVLTPTGSRINFSRVPIKHENSFTLEGIANTLTNNPSSVQAMSPTSAINQQRQAAHAGIVPSEVASEPVKKVPPSTIPLGNNQFVGGQMLDLNDVVLSDSFPNTRKNNGFDKVVLTPYMSSNDLGGLSVKKVPVPAQETGLPITKHSNGFDKVVLTPYMSSNDLGGVSVKKVPVPSQETGLPITKHSQEGVASLVVKVQSISDSSTNSDKVTKLNSVIVNRGSPTENNVVASDIPIPTTISTSDINGFSNASAVQDQKDGKTHSLNSGIPVALETPTSIKNAALDLLASLKSHVSKEDKPVVTDTGKRDIISLSPYASKSDFGGFSVQKISPLSKIQESSDILTSSGDLDIGTESHRAGVDIIAKVKNLVDSKNAETANKIDPIQISPYVLPNVMGGIKTKKISTPAQEPGLQGHAISKTSLSSKQDLTSDTTAMDLLAKIRNLVELHRNPTTATAVPMPQTSLPPTVSTKNVQLPADTCTPRSPNFRCKGKDLFLTMKSIGAWCLGMCIEKGCVETVCNCGCNLPLPKPSPSVQAMTADQRRMLSSFGNPTLEMTTTDKPPTTEEPPEEEEWEPEDGTTTQAPSTTVNPLMPLQWDVGGTAPSPHKDFTLNPIDLHSSKTRNIDQHVSKIDEVAWATELKSRLSKLAKNAGKSAGSNAVVGLNDNAQGTPPTESPSGGEAPPNWQGTEWYLPTPFPKKPPAQQENSGSPSVSGSSWQHRPLRDKWGRSERFTGNEESGGFQQGNGWNAWNMPTNSWGNGFSGGGGFDRRLSRFRFNWGSGSSSESGSGGEEQEANDR